MRGTVAKRLRRIASKLATSDALPIKYTSVGWDGKGIYHKRYWLKGTRRRLYQGLKRGYIGCDK